MKNLLIISILITSLAFSNKLNAQKVRWSYRVNKNSKGDGKPCKYKAGHSDNAAKFLEKSIWDSDPGIFHYHFHPFDAQQLIIYENYNPGAIGKIEIEYLVNKKKTRKIIYTAETKRTKEDFVRRNIYFDPLKNVIGVYLYLDYLKVEGINEISGVGLADFKEEYIAYINTPDSSAFVGEPMDMNDDVSGIASPTNPIISVDNKYIYFNHFNDYTNVYRGTIGDDGKLIEAKYCKYNLPIEKSTASGLSGISQDNNIMYINAMDAEKFNLYKVYLGKTLFGAPKWKYNKIPVRGFKSDFDDYQNEIMSYDGQYLIVRMAQTKGKYKGFDGELFVFFRQNNGSYAKPVHMGFDINTIEDEIPCYLAPDNKTLYFASSGHLSFGQADIFVTTRLDDSWQNWTMPINLGKPINSSEHENYFILDSKAEYAYFISWDGNSKSDLFRIKLAEPQKPKDNVIVKQIKPEPVIVFRGKVLDKKTSKPIYASIIYSDLETGKQLGSAMSNAETGGYSIALAMGHNYGFEATANNYITVSENVNAKQITESSIVDKDLYLIPIEVGQTIVLNNIFFETGKSTLKKESNNELNKLLKILQTNKSLKIEISGHTDNVGSASSNLTLSQSRAKAVVDWLVSHEIEESRFVAKGYGKSKPIATNDTEEGRHLNRRVEFTILEN